MSVFNAGLRQFWQEGLRWEVNSMARPGLAARGRDEFEATRPEYPMRYRTETAQNQRPTVPARIGAGSRPRRSSKRRDGLMLWRVLGASAAVLILGMGGLLAYNLVAPRSDTSQTAAAPTQPTPAAPATAVATAAPKPATPAQPKRIADAGHGQSAMKVASILGAGGETAAPAPAEVGPTAADFSRPAFLEPLNDTDEETLPASAVETVAERTPPDAAAPLPAPRPVKMASAETAASDDESATSARIRSAVTLRSGPRRSASAIGTLEGGTKVKLYSCKSWCEVSTGDKRGWVYKSSVDR
ncbi:SH3 domain-containing protein [Xanthobacter sp. YC-JY1]|nr:SH3 domain-containing protein [Xanthobacter sp. YC-JY1]